WRGDGRRHYGVCGTRLDVRPHRCDRRWTCCRSRMVASQERREWIDRRAARSLLRADRPGPFWQAAQARSPMKMSLTWLPLFLVVASGVAACGTREKAAEAEPD